MKSRESNFCLESIEVNERDVWVGQRSHLDFLNSFGNKLCIHVRWIENMDQVFRIVVRRGLGIKNLNSGTTEKEADRDQTLEKAATLEYGGENAFPEPFDLGTMIDQLDVLRIQMAAHIALN